MGYLLGAIDQEKLDNQRGVVQNEKRQGDNQPGGLVDYEVLDNLFPEGHPYHHATIGSMADLDAASLADVKQWFIDKYGPNNAVLVLAGDINAAEARPLVEKYFGAIKRGPVNKPAAGRRADAGRAQVDRDEGPRRGGPAAAPLGGARPQLAAARRARPRRLDPRRPRQLAPRPDPGARREARGVGRPPACSRSSASACSRSTATVKPGVDPAVVDKRLDEIIADYLANGPTEDEVRRAATRDVAGRIRGLEQVGGFGGKAVALAEGQVFAGDSDFYKKSLDAICRASPPADVRAAMQQWLGRPAFNVRLEPGDRPPYVEAKGAKKAKAADIADARRQRAPSRRSAQTPPLDFPDVSMSLCRTA